MQDNVLFDLKYANEHMFIAGVDEAGRGPLAGPVVVASVIMPLEEDKIIEGINDSKKLTEKKREELFEKIKEVAISYSIQEVSSNIIDSINILNATKLGMKNTINNLEIKPNFVLIDAVKLDINVPFEAVIKGDAKSYNIGAASILAKVYRDRLMKNLSQQYPEYNFAKHKGYGTREHIASLIKFGPCEIHRKSFISNFVKEEKVA